MSNKVLHKWLELAGLKWVTRECIIHISGNSGSSTWARVMCVT